MGDRVALVTGGARGIGASICKELAEQGRAVAVADLRDPDETVTAITEAGGTAAGVRMDITDAGAVSAGLDTIRSELGPIEILVNNAGWDEFHSFVDTDEDFWDRVIDINYKGALRLTHACLPAMTEAGWGRIVNLGSDAGRVGSSLEAVYSGAKGGIIAFTKTIAREVARFGVTANTVCPGPTDTPLLDDIKDASDKGEKVVGAMEKVVPMRRLGQPEELAYAVAFFASERAAFITGQTLSVSGGLTMAG